MTRSNLWAGAASGLSTPEIVPYRALPAAGGAAIALFGWLHRWTDPGVVDPVGLRVLAVLACAAAVVASFLGMRRALRVSLYVSVAAVTAWVLGLLALNRFSTEFAVLLLLVLTIAALFFEVDRHLLLYYACCLLLVLLLAAWIPQPQIRFAVYLPIAAMLCVLSYAALVLRRRNELKLARSDESYALAAAGANDGLWEWELREGSVRFSTRWKAMLGYAEEDISNSSTEWLGRVHPDDRERVRCAIEHCEPGSNFCVEYRIQHRNGEWRWMQARGARLAGGGARLAGSQADITDRKRAEAQLERQAMLDPLTGLANRALCLDRVDRLLRRTASAPGHSGFAVLFVDVDRFRVLNDSLGHPAGDRVLEEIARRLAPLVGVNDTLAHLGADDFVLVLDGTDGEAARHAAQRVRTAIARPYHLKDHEVCLGVTVGIALSQAAVSAEELLRDAELAMHRGKAARGRRVQVYDAAMHREALERLRLETELRQALARGELRVHFQAITELRSGQIAGFEALVRWLHPRRGLLAPSDFLPLAEETGLIIPLGHLVLREAAAAVAAWKAAGASSPLSVYVNLSPTQLLERRLIEEVTAVLHRFGLAPGELGVEITEGAILSEPGVALQQLARLRDQGVPVAIDDFGTGYSSLSYVHRLPVDTLKIDRSFITHLGHALTADAARDTELVGIIVLLARKLGLDVVAEGVETSEQLDAVRRLGCDRAQGNHLARPLAAPDCLSLLALPTATAARRRG